MKAGPDIALVASLLGDPARANMLTALMSGRALTASELASEAGVTPQTASAHLARLEHGGLVAPRKQGRHRYFSLTGDDVAGVLEGLMGLAARTGHMRTRTGPKDPALRRARVCYDHLAGDFGVRLFDTLQTGGHVAVDGEAVEITGAGRAFATEFGIDLAAIAGKRRPLCKACLDWSNRRNHLAGALGAALLGRIYALGWAKREPDSRVVAFSPAGEKAFAEAFGPAA